MQIDTLFERAKLPDGTLASIAVANGRISAIETDPAKAPSATEKVDLAGALLVPGFVEGHIHLDTSFIGDNWKPHRPCTNGFDVRERVQFQKENMATAAPMRDRARAPGRAVRRARHHADAQPRQCRCGGRHGAVRDHPGGARGIPRRHRHPARRVSAERRDLLSRHRGAARCRGRERLRPDRRARSGDDRPRRRGAARRGVRHCGAARRRRRHPPARSAHARRVPDRADRRAHARARHAGTRRGEPRLCARRGRARHRAPHRRQSSRKAASRS